MILVSEYIDRKQTTKKVRVLDFQTKKNLGSWWEYPNRPIKAFKITAKYVFIFI